MNEADPDALSGRRLAGFRKRLETWYKKHGRDLPWRKTNDPYAIWISETMLQQTLVATVIDYYHRFLKRFPTVDSLAAADEEDVLQLWAGLGYYRRARQLHAAAKKIVREYGGTFPRELESIRLLPGIGRYTAGAISSFAFNQAAPIVEANTVRLYSRLLAARGPTHTSAGQKRLWEFAEHLVAEYKHGGTLNQALMELGSLVCTPKNPRCSACPVADYCQAFQLGLETSIPAAKPPKEFTELQHIALIIPYSGKLLLRQNTAAQWWSGLWSFPWLDVQQHSIRNLKFQPQQPRSAASLRFVQSAFASELGIDCEIEEFFLTIKHGVTRYKISLHCYIASPLKIAGDFAPVFPAGNIVAESRTPTDTAAPAKIREKTAWNWFSSDQLPPLSSPAANIAKKLALRGGGCCYSGKDLFSNG